MKKQSGFTLIEILIVMVIVASLITIAIPRISPIDRLRSSVRRLSVITRETQTGARLSGNIYRLVFEMFDDEKKPATFWVESATGKNVELTSSNEKDKDKKEGETTSETGFQPDAKITKKKETLPSGFYFEDIQFSEKQKITSGKAYVYFFPQGFVTKTVIHITNKKTIHWTIVINPLTGVSSMIDHYKSMGELQ
jgi:general secretion pathway protein H